MPAVITVSAEHRHNFRERLANDSSCPGHFLLRRFPVLVAHSCKIGRRRTKATCKRLQRGALPSVQPPSSLISSARICSSLRRSVIRFSSKIRVISGLAFKFACAYCWSFRSIISSMSFTNDSAFISVIRLHC